MNLQDFELQKEDENSFTVGHPKGKSMTIPKRGLSDKAQKLIQKLKPVQKFDDGGAVQSDSVQDSPDQIAADAAQTPNNQIPSAPPTAMDATTPPVVVDPEDYIDRKPSSVIDMSDAYPANGDPMQQANKASDTALSTQEGATKAQAAALSGQGAAESKAFQQNQLELSKLPSLIDGATAERAKDATFSQQLQSQKIDPNRYWSHQGTGNKVAAGIGLLLSGMGSATTGQPNLAAQMIKNHVDNDIEAQKLDQSKTMNLWKMNREAYGNDVAANIATRNQLNTVLQNQIAKASSQFKGPQAQATAQAAIGQLEKEKADGHLKLAMMNGPSSDAPDPATRVPFLVPQAQQQKAFDEIDAAKATAQNGPKIMQAFDNAANNIHAVDFVPWMDNADQKALHALMGPTFKDVEGTVRQAAMDNMAKNTTPQFGDDANTIATKRAALVGYLRSKANSSSTNKGFGIDLSKFPSTNFNPQPPAQTKAMNGVQYQKVQGGWKKVQ